MEHPPRGASVAPSIKCSNCEIEVPLHFIADHVCSQVPATGFVEEPEQMIPVPSVNTQHPLPTINRAGRPFVPRIDPFAVGRPGLNGELTPASSQGSIGHSPISPGTGRRSPFLHPPRKASAPVLRRPPSPELLSQDCAFPPFPTNKTKSKTNNATSRKNSIRGRTTAPEAGHSSRSTEQDAKRSASAGAPRARYRHGTNDSSRPSTANSSRQPSLSSRAGSRQGSIDEVPPLPPLQPSVSHTATVPDSETQPADQPATWPELSNASQVQSSQHELSTSPEVIREHSEPPISEHKHSSPQPDELTASQSIPELSSGNVPHEPSYRTKRPPPISDLPSNTMAELPSSKPEPSPREAPPPTPSSTIARTLTNLFGRKRNPSTSSKKAKGSATEGPRFIALSPDPDPQEIPYMERAPHDSSSTEISTVCPVHGVRRVRHTPADVTPPEMQIAEPLQAQVLEPEEVDERSRDSVKLEHDLEQTLESVVPVPRLSMVPEQMEDTKRASIDSASSYGSEGFSQSRRSSLSTGALNAHSYGSSISTARTTTSSEEFLSPAFAKLRGVDTMPESPTDPYMHFGRLAPVPETKPISSEEEQENVVPSTTSASPLPENEGGYFDLAQHSRQRRPSTPGATRGMCRGCSRMILSGQKSVSSKDGRLTGRYHKECFVCKTCREPFATADFYVHKDLPYCAHDYHVINGTLCESCGKGIEGHYLETSNLNGNGAKKFHPQCLRCATCKIQLNEDYFEFGGSVYCEKDAFRMINNPRSPYGTAPSRPSPLNREYISSGEPGQILAAGKFPERRLTRLITTS